MTHGIYLFKIKRIFVEMEKEGDSTCACVCVCVYASARGRANVRASVRACARARVCVCVCVCVCVRARPPFCLPGSFHRRRCCGRRSLYCVSYGTGLDFKLDVAHSVLEVTATTRAPMTEASKTFCMVDLQLGRRLTPRRGVPRTQKLGPPPSQTSPRLGNPEVLSFVLSSPE